MQRLHTSSAALFFGHKFTHTLNRLSLKVQEGHAQVHGINS